MAQAPIIKDSTGQDIVTAIQALSAPSATSVAVDATGMDIITAENAQGALKQLDTAVDTINSSLTQLTVVPRIGSVVVTPNASYYDISIAELTSSSQAPWAILGTETGGARVNDVQIVESGKLRVHFSATISSQTRINYGYFKTFSV